MNNVNSLKTLTESLKYKFESYNVLRKELNILEREIERLKNNIDREVVFDKELKNAEQRDAEKKSRYFEDENLQSNIVRKEDIYHKLKDLEASMEYYSNLIAIDLKLLGEEAR